jgi:hypothetical protein
MGFIARHYWPRARPWEIFAPCRRRTAPTAARRRTLHGTTTSIVFDACSPSAYVTVSVTS